MYEKHKIKLKIQCQGLPVAEQYQQCFIFLFNFLLRN